MAKRFRLGLNFFFNNHNNSGRVNYIYNVIAALKTIPDDEKPELIVFYSKDSASISQLEELNYPYIQFVIFQPYPSQVLVRKLNSLVVRLFNRDFYKRWKNFRNIDGFYPYEGGFDSDFKEAKNKLHWLVDFNNRAFADHWQDKGANVTAHQKKLTSQKVKVVLSSGALFNELKHYHPNYKCDIKILRFASSLPHLTDIDVPALLKKYKINESYFISPNQFWEHKNQGVVLQALTLIKQVRPDLKFKVLFTGSMDVNRGKGLYANELMQQIEAYGLQDCISFLGVVDRNDQLVLMKNAAAIIQPSLYEGWSTLVEEAKALQQFIILSDIPVHREQITSNAIFFNPKDAKELADKMIGQLLQPYKIVPLNYQKNIEEFGKSLMDAFQE